MIAAAVETRFWPLYEVVDGRYRLTYEPRARAAGRATGSKGRSDSRISCAPRTHGLVEEIQQSVDRDWAELRSRCGDDEKGALS